MLNVLPFAAIDSEPSTKNITSTASSSSSLDELDELDDFALLVKKRPLDWKTISGSRPLLSLDVLEGSLLEVVANTSSGSLPLLSLDVLDGMYLVVELNRITTGSLSADELLDETAVELLDNDSTLLDDD